jgi:hypothetical protein
MLPTRMKMESKGAVGIGALEEVIVIGCLFFECTEYVKLISFMQEQSKEKSVGVPTVEQCDLLDKISVD